METIFRNSSSRWVDLTLPLTKDLLQPSAQSDSVSLFGHVGTHFDAMGKPFPLEYFERKGIVFDVPEITDRDISVDDIDLQRIRPDMFVVFHTGWIEAKKYGTEAYRKEHPQLSRELIETLISLRISMIGIDAAGIRRGKEHTPADQYCSDHGVFIVENLCNLSSLKEKEIIIIHTCPMNLIGFSGIPCRVIADIMNHD